MLHTEAVLRFRPHPPGEWQYQKKDKEETTG